MSTKRFRGRLILRSVAPDDPALLAALIAAGLLTKDLAGSNMANFVFVNKTGEPVAYGGYTVLGNISLLRSLVVLPQWRNLGVGARLATALLSQLQGINVSTVFLLTDSADMFFASLGFAAIKRDEAPEAIRATGQYERYCSENAVLMMRPLDEMMRMKLDDIHPVPRS